MPVRPTSAIAKRSIRSVAGTMRAKVFIQILEQGTLGATLEELEGDLVMPGNTLRPRRQELEQRGLVVDSGLKRPTTSGRMAIVWIVPEEVALAAKHKLTSKGMS